MNFEEQYNALVRHLGTPLPNTPKPYEYVVEECAELIQAIQHLKRKRKDAYNHVVNEMADVYTLMDTLCYYLGITESEIRYYQSRLIERYLNQPNDGRHIPDGLVDQTKEE